MRRKQSDDSIYKDGYTSTTTTTTATTTTSGGFMSRESSVPLPLCINGYKDQVQEFPCLVHHDVEHGDQICSPQQYMNGLDWRADVSLSSCGLQVLNVNPTSIPNNESYTTSSSSFNFSSLDDVLPIPTQHQSLMPTLATHHVHDPLMFTTPIPPKELLYGRETMVKPIEVTLTVKNSIEHSSTKLTRRRNVRISKDPQSVAARHRRER